MGHTSGRAAYKRTRADHSSETAEDYVEAIAGFTEGGGLCRVKDLAGRFGVSHVTVSRTVARLVDAGLAETEPRQPISLTAKGRRVAREAARRHEIVYRFLLSIGVEERVAALDSEGIEHHVSRQTLERFEALAAGAPRGV
jgi:DtxR family manganese transport transcriptional regulator